MPSRPDLPAAVPGPGGWHAINQRNANKNLGCGGVGGGGRYPPFRLSPFYFPAAPSLPPSPPPPLHPLPTGSHLVAGAAGWEKRCCKAPSYLPPAPLRKTTLKPPPPYLYHIYTFTFDDDDFFPSQAGCCFCCPERSHHFPIIFPVTSPSPPAFFPNYFLK